MIRSVLILGIRPATSISVLRSCYHSTGGHSHWIVIQDRGIQLIFPGCINPVVGFLDLEGHDGRDFPCCIECQCLINADRPNQKVVEKMPLALFRWFRLRVCDWPQYQRLEVNSEYRKPFDSTHHSPCKLGEVSGSGHSRYGLPFQ